ncbi:uncharacterized protein LOC117117021 [Anneissia japonica]|uniref:uncharacterized protein LOC117117021 n=1 Tax=Anneissia japonica TaxID=1529436 RepID=UPI0014257EB9|nr:uncharacterized protein LOC117117021 [Anneissia japonica]
MLVAVVMEKHWTFNKMGIDMSAAFDSIRRSTILNLLNDAGCCKDEVRLVRFLLANTRLRVKIKNVLSEDFQSTIGSFQGDSLSGALFTLTLAGALRHVRAVIPRPNPPISFMGMPRESEYADDVDFLDEDPQIPKHILPTVKTILQEWNLSVNEDKTEFTQIYMANKQDLDSSGNKIKDNKSWCSSKLLGSFLDSIVDVKQRIILGNVSFSRFNKIWNRRRCISLQRRLIVYEAQVVSVMLYDCNSWSVPNSVLDDLDITHRRHLRHILNIKLPNVIRNHDLYKVTGVNPLSERVTKS